jgi:hypothetical protein
MKKVSDILAISVTTACATRAPSTFELDKKAGLTPTLDVEAHVPRE